MTQDYTHPIAPPPEFIGEWWIAWDALDETDRPRLEDFIAVKAAQWGADRELEECCEWAINDFDLPVVAEKLRAARRPKPPSLKEQALDALSRIDCADTPTSDDCFSDIEIIRIALEQLSNPTSETH